ncbi:MAG TPA: GNAT family N-acetyltransferase [Geminicoccaceae bacterium]|nr:GNAT family N-acetyltransferase [Geminicoccaceae bacterium]
MQLGAPVGSKDRARHAVGQRRGAVGALGENLAPGTWYVNVLATFVEYRGRGYGSRLLGIAERLAAAAGRFGLSIIVSDANAGARRLYERCGCVEVAMRPMVKEGWENPGENWVLLVKRAGAGA